MKNRMKARLALAALLGASLAGSAPQAELTGFARLPADTFAAGPPSGRLLTAAGSAEGFPAQPVQGFSSMRPDRDRAGWWLALCDNGYGTKANSADFILRIYAVRPDWRSSAGGTGTVEVGRMIQLSDPDRRVPFRITREDTPERWLTGADFDPESFVQAPDGTFWIGDEFGPFLLHADAAGRLMAPPFEVAGLRSPDHPALAAADAAAPGPATVGRSRGFEGLAMHADGTRLMALLESPPSGDPPGATRVFEFDLAAQRFSGRSWGCALDGLGGNATELVSYAPDWYLMIQRDNAAGSEARLKVVTALQLGDTAMIAPAVRVANLLDIADPRGLGGVGPVFTFPFITPEAVWVEDLQTLVLVNDNNYPGGGGRPPAGSKDASEFIRIRLASPLPH